MTHKKEIYTHTHIYIYTLYVCIYIYYVYIYIYILVCVRVFYPFAYGHCNVHGCANELLPQKVLRVSSRRGIGDWEVPEPVRKHVNDVDLQASQKL